MNRRILILCENSWISRWSRYGSLSGSNGCNKHGLPTLSVKVLLRAIVWHPCRKPACLEQIKGNRFYGKAINPASKEPEATLGHWYGKNSSEDDAWYRSEKFNSHGVRITRSYDWRNGNCDAVDSQKFRGRGFKQLTGRSNYADCWTFRGWLSISTFTADWWTDPSFRAHNRSGMKKIPATIDAPPRMLLFLITAWTVAGFI